MRIYKYVVNSLIVLTAALYIASPLAAQLRSERYPTDNELEQLIEKFYQNAQRLESNQIGSAYVRDRRTTESKQLLKSFTNSWISVAPEAAPFFGSWQGYESQITIYPSTKKNYVCIIFTGEGMGSFLLGKVSQKKIYTTRDSIIFRRGRYLGQAIVTKNQPITYGETPYNSPRPLENPREFIKKRVMDSRERSAILQEYDNADCTISLPKS